MTELCEEFDQQKQKDAAEDLPDHPWSIPPEEITGTLDVDPEQGLSPEEVDDRREHFGPNCISTPGVASPLEVLLNQARNSIFWVLTGAAIVAAATGKVVEAIAIMVAVVVNVAIGFFTEMKAVRSMEALEQMGAATANVLRGGEAEELDAEALVPGDIVKLTSGRMINADLRLLESENLEANESALTGESVPVAKSAEPVEDGAELAERASMLYKGTAITRGEGRAVVVATGMNTELGLISSLTEEARESATPLEKRLDILGRRLVYATLVIAAGVAIAGIAAGRETQLMLETTIALAVATVPEALPIVATVALGRGMLRMARRNALVKELPAVETLGATSVIAVDKTGTLTEDRMTVRRILLEADEVQVSGGPLTDEGELQSSDETVGPDDIPGLRELLEVGALCTNASLEENDGEDKEAKFEGTGDPTEVALLIVARKAGIERDTLLERMPEVEEKSFSRETKMMATIHEAEGEYRVAIKGAPEAVLEISTTILTPDGEQDLSDDRRQEWLDQTEDLAGEGLRLLAMAQKQMQDREGEVYEAATFLGLVGMIDPAREGVADAIQRCQDAGIRFVMMTGDQAQTAYAVAREVGLIVDEGDDHQHLIEGGDLGDPDELSEEHRKRARKAQVLARVTPEQKLHLIDLHQEAGRTVAMTGDGVNDAPALKKADIGIAMGKRGTQVAREAADMVLEDDRLDTIVAAVEQGRIIFGNIRQFVLFLFSVSLSEVLVVAVASVAMAEWPLPILPLQILFLNVVTYVFPALALGTGGGPGDVMARDPRPRDETVMECPQWIDLAALSIIIAAPALASLWLATEWLGLEGNRVTTLAFMTIAGGQLLNVFNVRDRRSGIFVNDVTENPWVWGAVALCLILIAGALFIPGLADVLKTAWPGTDGLLLAIGLSVVTLVLGQIYIGMTNRGRESHR